MLAWSGFDRATADPGRDAAFSAVALTGADARSRPTRRHARHGAATIAGGRTAPLGPARARHVTAGLVLVCGSVLAATVTATDGTLGPPDGSALPELAPGEPAQAALPADRAPVETAAVSSPVTTALAAGPAAGSVTARRSPDRAAGTVTAVDDRAQPARSTGVAPGSGGPSAVGDGASSPHPSGSTSTEQPEPSGTGSEPPPDGGSDGDSPSPVERVTEPVEQVTEPVERVAEPVTSRLAEPVERVAEPVTRVAEPVTRVAEPVTKRLAGPVEDAGQPAMSMLDAPLP